MSIAVLLLGEGVATAQEAAAEATPDQAGDAAGDRIGDAEVGAWEVGGFLGAHVFSRQSALGAVNTAGPSLSNTIALGLRLGYALSPALTLEGAVPLMPTTARDSEEGVFVAVLEPQLHLRLGGGTLGGIEPFALLGVGVPIALSTDEDTVTSDVLTNLQAGAGFQIARTSGWTIRFESRAAMLPARGAALATFEFELLASLQRRLGAPREQHQRAPVRRVADADWDGVPDADDRCPERDEDRDGFEDDDGCPDIDDDRDEVLDVADQCRLAPETVNGYRDTDGCPDEIPQALRELGGDALRFRRGSATLRPRARAALDEVAATLAQYRSVRIVIVGHCDAREVPDDAAAEALSLARAEATRDALVALGVPPRRLEVWARGRPREFSSEDAAGRNRARNRRVTLQVLRPDLPIPTQLDDFESSRSQPNEAGSEPARSGGEDPPRNPQ